MRPSLALVAATVLLGASTIGPAARAGVELVLRDGRTLVGETAELRDDVYLVVLETGESFTVPVGLVTEIRLGEGFDDKPTGMVVGIPRTLAGAPGPARTPTPAEQLEAFGRPPATFPRSTVQARWRPRDAFEGRSVEFDPVRWYQPPIDPIWRPRSAFRASQDVTEFNPVRWYRPPIDPTWRPRSAWGPRTWFAGGVRNRESR